MKNARSRRRSSDLLVLVTEVGFGETAILGDDAVLSKGLRARDGIFH